MGKERVRLTSKQGNRDCRDDENFGTAPFVAQRPHAGTLHGCLSSPEDVHAVEGVFQYS